ncbi:MAG: PEGA domain-containing protein [Panacagrimonas sp.]
MTETSRAEPRLDATDARIAPVPYRAAADTLAPARRRVSALWISLGGLGVFVGVSLLFFVLARSVQIQTTPVAAALDVDGGIGFALGSSYLLLPGDYLVRAQAEGYQPLEASFEVGDSAQQSFSFELQRLPGKLNLISDPVAEVFIDGNPRGTSPLQALELSPGTHQLLLRAPRYQAYEAQLQIEGGGIEQTLKVELQPGWAPVSLDSRPVGADILVDGQNMGRTPQTLELGAGMHELKLQLAGYATWRDAIQVIANESLQLPTVTLTPAQGVIRLSSEPAGATVTVAGALRGQTPMDLGLTPGTTHIVKLSAPGHRPTQREVQVQAEQSQELRVSLEPILGPVTFDIQPADAQLKVDGRVIDASSTRLELTATAHRVEVSKAGFAPYTGSVTPRPGFEQSVVVRLKSEAEARAERLPARVAGSKGPDLVLIQPGSFRMGTPRGEQGRQTNEAQRPVKLTRAFYLATTETTNAQFRRYQPSHSSGIIRRETLDNENQPVARVSWTDAVRYCNWLSQQEGLPPAYVEEGGNLVLAQPVTTGYRLPSEAEWEWAARFAGGRALRFPWGSGLPPPPKSGNFADPLAEGLAAQVIAGYEDSYAAASPVRSFAPDALGLFDMGGNVAEWVHDAYDAAMPINPPEALDPFGPAGSADRVIRGSSWLHGRLIELRLAYREGGREARPDLGFRVARYAE